MKKGSIDPYYPINWTSPLNRGLKCWLLASQYKTGVGTNTWKDLVSDNHGILSGPVWTNSFGRRNGHAALSFNGSNYVTLPSRNETSVVFCSAWIRPHILPGTNQQHAIIGHFTTHTAANSYSSILSIDSIGAPFYIFYDGTVRTITASRGGNVDEWYHIAAYCNTNDDIYKLFVNGVDVTLATPGSAGAPSANVTSFFLAATTDVPFFPLDLTTRFNGEMDDVRWGESNNEIGANRIYEDSIYNYSSSLNHLRARTYFLPLGPAFTGNLSTNIFQSFIKRIKNI